MLHERYASAAAIACEIGLGVNAGHDLSLTNLERFCQIPNILELSIGHVLIRDALYMGISEAVHAYLNVLAKNPTGSGGCTPTS